MKKEDTANRRAMLGVPDLALMHDRNAIGRKEGFDSHGNFWYQTHSSRMEPEIHKESYLALVPLRSVDDATSYNGETYVLVARHGGVEDTIVGRVVSAPGAGDAVTLSMLNPKVTVDIRRDFIVEAYLVTCALTVMSTPHRP